MSSPHESTTQQFQDALAHLEETVYELTLFVSGASDLSARAIANVRHLCENYLNGRYHLLVIDLFDDPDAAISAGVLAAPTLVKRLPLPVRRLVGDLSKTERVLVALEIASAHRAPRTSG
jgi:circadian clock protein KaiB